MASNPDPNWLDQQYNNRARVAGSADILARWAAQSKAARERMKGALDLAYGAAPAERLDVFSPPGARDAPVLVFIHGGWWRALDKSDHSFLAEEFVREGAVVVVPNYALCPAVTIETIALQMTRALAWVWRSVGQHGGDPRQIVVAGHSAGAHLASLLMCCEWPTVGADLPLDLVTSAIGISGVYDLEPIRQTPFLAGDLRLTPAAVARLSTARFRRPSGQFLAVVGGDESEEFLRQNRLLHEAWGERSVPVCEALPGRNHFDVLDELAQAQGRVHRLVREQWGR